MNNVVLAEQTRSPRAAGSLARKALLVLALVAIAAGVLLIRGWRPTSTAAKPATPAPTALGMPTSPEIEAKYGIRFTSVDVTSGGGMIQLRYIVLDGDKTLAIHDAAAAPFVVDAKGTKYADPGMVGHSHVAKAKSPGSADYILLANAKGGVKPGSIVTVKVGDLSLRNVRVL